MNSASAPIPMHHQSRKSNPFRIHRDASRNGVAVQDLFARGPNPFLVQHARDTNPPLIVALLTLARRRYVASAVAAGGLSDRISYFEPALLWLNLPALGGLGEGVEYISEIDRLNYDRSYAGLAGRVAILVAHGAPPNHIALCFEGSALVRLACKWGADPLPIVRATARHGRSRELHAALRAADRRYPRSLLAAEARQLVEALANEEYEPSADSEGVLECCNVLNEYRGDPRSRRDESHEVTEYLSPLSALKGKPKRIKLSAAAPEMQAAFLSRALSLRRRLERLETDCERFAEEWHEAERG